MKGAVLFVLWSLPGRAQDYLYNKSDAWHFRGVTFSGEVTLQQLASIKQLRLIDRAGNQERLWQGIEQLR